MPGLVSGSSAGIFLGALALLAHLLFEPAINVTRRCVGMVLDITALTAILLWGGAGTALFYPLYLWVTLGMGFRYGQSYLLASAVLTVIGFAMVISLTPSWHEHLPLTLSLWSALLILPAYALSLLKKLTHALHRAEEANRTKGRFLATMSHELRTPLHAIIGMSELLQARHLDTEQRQMVETVHSAGHTLLEMIEDVLDVARIESGRIVKDADEFDLHMVLKSVRSLLYRQIRSKGIDLHFEVDPEMPYRLHGVSRWVRQILINLLGNAIKFTDEGGIVIRVWSEPIDADRILLRIDVEDTGIGISEDALERIFDRFVQVDESTTRHYGGTGLGLAIARQLAERLGGQLTVTSEVGKGACFSFVAPFQRSQVEEKTTLDGRVLILGDVEGRYSRLLTSWGASPALAEDWPDAMGVFDHEKAFRALLVINPVIDGHQQQFKTMISNSIFLQPIDVISVGDPGLPDDWPCLARLPEDHDAGALYRTLHAALAVPTPITRRRPLANEALCRQRRILVAEDNRTNQRVIEKMLRVGGHEVAIVDGGEDLLDRLDDENEGFDLVLVDLNMPVMTGLDAVKLHRMASGTRASTFRCAHRRRHSREQAEMSGSGHGGVSHQASRPARPLGSD